MQHVSPLVIEHYISDIFKVAHIVNTCRRVNKRIYKLVFGSYNLHTAIEHTYFPLCCYTCILYKFSNITRKRDRNKCFSSCWTNKSLYVQVLYSYLRIGMCSSRKPEIKFLQKWRRPYFRRFATQISSFVRGTVRLLVLNYCNTLSKMRPINGTKFGLRVCNYFGYRGWNQTAFPLIWLVNNYTKNNRQLL